MHEQTIRKLNAQANRLADENRRLQEDNADLFVYHIDNVLPVPQWAATHAGDISNSAVLSLIRNGDISSVQKGRHHYIVLTTKTLSYRKGNRGPRSTRTPKPSPQPHPNEV